MTTRVVYDCNVLLQAVLSRRGPAFRCLELAEAGRVTLLVSRPVLVELHDVLERPSIRAANPQVTPERVAAFLDLLARRSELRPEPPSIFSLPRDPKDEPYLNMALASDARYLVSWNERHLGYLMRGDTPEGAAFVSQFPTLRIVTPVAFLRELGELESVG